MSEDSKHISNWWSQVFQKNQHQKTISWLKFQKTCCSHHRYMKTYSKTAQNILKKNFKDLSSSEIKKLRDEGILNGFGCASQSWLARFFIWIILADFDEAIPDWHDFWYAVGGDEARRLECDENFYQAMLNDIRARYDRKECWKWELVWKSIIAGCAYTAIRWRWSRFFFYH